MHRKVHIKSFWLPTRPTALKSISCTMRSVMCFEHCPMQQQKDTIKITAYNYVRDQWSKYAYLCVIVFITYCVRMCTCIYTCAYVDMHTDIII